MTAVLALGIFSAEAQPYYNNGIQAPHIMKLGEYNRLGMDASGNIYAPGALNPNPSSACVTKILPNGTTSWTSVFGSPTQNHDFNSTLPLADGSIIVAGTRNIIAPPSFGDQTLIVHKLNSSGAPVWSTELVQSVNMTFAPYLTQLNNGNIVVASLGLGLSPTASSTLAILNTSGTVLLYNELEYYPWNLRVIDVLAVSDGGFIICGEAKETDNNADGFIAKFDSLGNHVWTQRVNFGDYTRFLGVTEDTGHVCCRGRCFDQHAGTCCYCRI